MNTVKKTNQLVKAIAYHLGPFQFVYKTVRMSG